MDMLSDLATKRTSARALVRAAAAGLGRIASIGPACADWSAELWETIELFIDGSIGQLPEPSDANEARHLVASAWAGLLLVDATDAADAELGIDTDGLEDEIIHAVTAALPVLWERIPGRRAPCPALVIEREIAPFEALGGAVASANGTGEEVKLYLQPAIIQYAQEKRLRAIRARVGDLPILDAVALLGGAAVPLGHVLVHELVHCAGNQPMIGDHEGHMATETYDPGHDPVHRRMARAYRRRQFPGADLVTDVWWFAAGPIGMPYRDGVLDQTVGRGDFEGTGALEEARAFLVSDILSARPLTRAGTPDILWPKIEIGTHDYQPLADLLVRIIGVTDSDALLAQLAGPADRAYFERIVAAVGEQFGPAAAERFWDALLDVDGSVLSDPLVFRPYDIDPVYTRYSSIAMRWTTMLEGS